MLPKTTLIIMARWAAAGRCKKRLAKDIGVKRAAYIQSMLTKHTFSVARVLEEKGLIEIQLAVSGIAPKAAKRWGNAEGIKTIKQQGNNNANAQQSWANHYQHPGRRRPIRG